VLAKAGDLAAILTNLEPRDVLFIDEIHRLGPAVEEILYPAMEDHVLDLIIGEGPSARSIRIELAPFTLVAATTRAGLWPRPCATASASRCGWSSTRRRSSRACLLQAARKMGADLTEEGARDRRPLARHAAHRGRLLRRVRDFAGAEQIDRKRAASALARPEVDEAASTASTAATSAP
jgi:Holliday junction DNA helicase RuvB